uniref:Protein kinase domain-containing protein n=1 Tax=Lotus japonicus TaxID=34305 RepID=I3S4C6_LOTJA|nr:unknown [Lotus japonicus]
MAKIGLEISRTTRATVCEGDWDGRKSVAIKRINDKDKAHNEAIKYKEYDKGLNVVRLHYEDVREDHSDLILEKADCTLTELMNSYFWGRFPETNTEVSSKKLDFLRKIRDEKLLGDGKPCASLKIIKDIVNAVGYLQWKGELHYNIEPDNVFIFYEAGALRAKLSLSQDGTVGWRAPKPKNHPSQENLMFGLGLVVYYCITGGKHAFGDIDSPAQCQKNIDSNKLQLGVLSEESRDMITHLLKPIATDRLDIPSVLCHPFFWDIKKKSSLNTELNIKLRSATQSHQIYALNKEKKIGDLTTNGISASLRNIRNFSKRETQTIRHLFMI